MSIIDKIEFEETININKKHISSIILGQNKNSKPLNLVVFLLNILEHNFCFKNIHMNESKCFEIFIQTLSQARSEVWKKERMFRLSVSVKVHKIKTCKNWTVQGLSKLSDTLFLEDDLGHKGNINVKYGKQTKQIAPEVFKTLWRKDILECELIIDSIRPWVCSSPDGITLNDSSIESVLEIKCLITCKNKPIIKDNESNLKYLHIDKNEKLSLK